ncbi:GntR family transcriptional regulator [Streptomyces synnematoformans]
MAAEMRSVIERQELTAGEALPSEAVLTERYAVARRTVRQALA